MPPINCANAGLTAYSPTAEKPWNQQRVVHLYRRIAFGSGPQGVDFGQSQNPAQFVSDIVAAAVNLPLAPEPEWSDWLISDYSPIEEERNEQIVAQWLEWASIWLSQMKNNGLRDRMSWFWHNHFVTQLDVYFCPSWLYRYHKLLQQYALGNFKDFVRDMGITPAMLVFLNNVQNTQFDINENFARELYELFTLGVDNGYTQNDIVDTARAVTGWNDIDVNNFCGDINFVNAFWDSGEKTIFGQTGNWNYFDVIEILFEQRAVEISEYICGKIYKHFVNPEEDEIIIAELAQIFRDSNWELSVVMEAMFKSEHFFEEANIGTVIPGHIEYFINFINEMDYPDDTELIFGLGFSASDFNQRIFNPTDVSGWPGNRNWITSASLTYRWKGITDTMGYYYSVQGESLEHIRTWSFNLFSEFEADPTKVVNGVIDFFLPKGLQHPEEYDEALAVFKGEVPENYFTDGTWNLSWEYAPYQLFLLVIHISNLPEFQLR